MMPAALPPSTNSYSNSLYVSFYMCSTVYDPLVIRRFLLFSILSTFWAFSTLHSIFKQNQTGFVLLPAEITTDPLISLQGRKQVFFLFFCFFWGGCSIAVSLSEINQSLNREQKVFLFFLISVLYQLFSKPLLCSCSSAARPCTLGARYHTVFQFCQSRLSHAWMKNISMV